MSPEIFLLLIAVVAIGSFALGYVGTGIIRRQAEPSAKSNTGLSLKEWALTRVTPFSIEDAATAAGMDRTKLTPDHKTRLSIALRKIGCRRLETVDTTSGEVIRRRWYLAPERKDA